MTYYIYMFTRNQDLNISHRYGIDTLFLGVCFIYLYTMFACVFIQLYYNSLKDDLGRQQEKRLRYFNKCKNNNCNQESELEEEEKSKHLTCLSGVINVLVEVTVTGL